MKRFLTVMMFVFVLFTAQLSADDNARLQIIHNSADPAAAVVDIYVNESLFQPNFEFRSATPFLDVPSGVTLNIGVAPGGSSGPGDIIATIPVSLEEEETYIAIANGVLDPNAFAANPDGVSTAFDLFIRKNAREEARWSSFVDFTAFHGSTDAPTVNINIRGSFFGPTINDLTYGEFSWYRTVWPKKYILDITPGNDNSTVVASFEADLSGLRGGAATVFASGFFDPSMNQGGPAFGLYAALADGTVIELPSEQKLAKIQIIHNAADPAASLVDIYINDVLTLPDFAFRTATPFLEVPAEVELNVGVAPAGSDGPEDIIASFPFTLANNQTYVAIANGVLNPGDFADNPDGISIGFDIYARDDVRQKARWWNRVDFLVFHGSTDAPTVDVIARDVGKLVDNASYGMFTDYLSVPAAEYVLDITPGSDNSTVVASFIADLSGLKGGAAVVFASGFLNPAANQDGAAFGLFAALPDGTVVEFPVKPKTALLQVIHNAADPAASSVDIYVNEVLTLPNFDFRTATPFLEVPAEVELNIGVAPAGSSGPGDIIATFPFSLVEDETYVAIANGVLNPGAFATNPDGMDIGFNIYPAADISTEADSYYKVDLIAFHGATDAPTVDVVARGAGILFDNLTYGGYSTYQSVPPSEYILDITLGNDNNTIVVSYLADLSGLGGGAAVAFASGFLSPGDNQNGAAFGLFAALPDGTVVEFPVYTPMTATARLQVIHNSPDPAAEVVDIYVNGDLFQDDFEFRTATPFLDVPAGVTLNIGVAPGNSTGAGDIIATIPVTLQEDQTYVAIANGVLNPDNFADNPDGKSIGFNLYARDGVREEGNYRYFTDLLVFHGSPDAPTVDVRIKGLWWGPLVNDLAYGEFSSYKTVWPLKYVLNITPGDQPYNVVASFVADLKGLGGGAAVVFASGFLNPADNQNGPAFGLFAALPDGTVVELPAYGSSNYAMELAKVESVPEQFELGQNYPNPFNPTTNISFSLPESGKVSLRVYNVLGQEVRTLVDEYLDAGVHTIQFDASNLSSGMYFYRLNTESFTESKKMMLVK